MQETESPNSQPSGQLLIRSVPEGFLFCGPTPEGLETFRLRIPAPIDFPEFFESFLQEKGWANNKNLQTTLVDFTHRFLLVPTEFSDDDSIREFFRFQLGSDPNQQTYTAPSDDEKQTFCWEIDLIRDEVYERLLPGVNVWATSFLLSNWTCNQAQRTQQTTLTVHFYGQHMQVFGATAEKLVFANTFIVKSTEEILYFILRVVEQLSFSPLLTNVVLCSESTPFEMLEFLLNPYLKNIWEGTFTTDAAALFRMKNNASDEQEEEEDETEETDHEA